MFKFLQAKVAYQAGSYLRFPGTSEGEDSSCEDSKAGVENGAAKKTTRDSETTERHGNQQVFGKWFERQREPLRLPV